MFYIGITDFPSGDQSLDTLRFFDSLCDTPKMAHCKLMVGVMMSFKTMTGKPSKWTSIWPKKEEIGKIFVDHPRAFNALHYADYNGYTSVAHLVEAVEWGGPELHAIQLDMIWPPDVIVKGLKKKHPNIKIVLQINTDALEVVEYNPDLLVEWLRRYDGVVDYALLDKSHGKGVGMEADILLPFLRVIRDRLPDIGLAAAGGLGPYTMHLVEPLIRNIGKDISIDMQGQLRPSGNAEDPICWRRADNALVKAVDMYTH
jgi:hypothetical protein